jgi:hypothetical protein
MPSQRSHSKRSVGGYLDDDIKALIKATGLEETQFVEFALLRSFLIRGDMTRTEVNTLAEQGRINPQSVTLLKKEKLL